MSNPGFPSNLSTQQLTPEFLQQMQQYQDQQKKMQLAQGLMGNKATGQYGGLANAGSDIAGAVAQNQLQNQANWNAQGLGNVAVTPQVGTTGLGRLGSQIGNLFGMGGGS